MMLHAIDLHKRVLQVAAMHAHEEGDRVKETRMPACKRALGAYLRQWPGIRHRVVVEATGAWYWVADVLAEHKAELQLAHPAKVRAITEAKVKTDGRDARTLLTMLRLNMVPKAHVISRELRGLRDLLRMRLQLVEKRTSSMNSIARLLEKYNCATVPALPELAQQQAGFHEVQIKLLSAQIKALEKRVRNELKPNETVRRLRRIPGIGPLNAWAIYLEIDGIDRFPTERQFFSYCRLVPGADNSGGRSRSKRSRAGNQYLKLAFSHAAVRAKHHYAEIGAAFNKKLRKKNDALARAWVRKELARIVYHVLKDDVEYDNTFRGVALSKPKRA